MPEAMAVSPVRHQGTSPQIVDATDSPRLATAGVTTDATVPPRRLTQGLSRPPLAAAPSPPGSEPPTLLGALHVALRNVSSTSGRVRDADIGALTQRVAAIDALNDPQLAAAGRTIVGRLADRRVDAVDVDDFLVAIATIKAREPRGPSIPALRNLLAQVALAAVNVSPTHLDFELDMRAVRDSGVSDFPAVSRITLPPGEHAQPLRLAVADRLSVREVLADGERARFRVSRGRLEVEAPRARTLEVRHTVRAHFIDTDEDFATASGLIVDRRDPANIHITSLTWPYNADQLFPANPDPPAVMHAAARLLVPDDFTTVGAEVTTPVPAYSVAVRASNNLKVIEGPTTAGGVKLNFHVYRDGGLRPDGDFTAALRDIGRGLDAVAAILGTPYPDGVINFVQTPNPFGGMEHQGMPAINDSAIEDNSRVPDIVKVPLHEAVHGYFGNGRAIDGWANFTMSEGLTQYLTYRGVEASLGVASSAEAWQRSREVLARTLAGKKQPLVGAAEGDVYDSLNAVPYELGAWILRMAEERVGREQLDAVLGELARAKPERPLSVEEWVRYLTLRTGVDFAPVYAGWGNIGGVPQYDVDVRRDATRVELLVRRLGVRLPSGTKVPVVVSGQNGERATVRVSLSDGESIDGGLRQSFDVGFPVAGVAIDPEHSVLAIVRSREP